MQSVPQFWNTSKNFCNKNVNKNICINEKTEEIVKEWFFSLFTDIEGSVINQTIVITGKIWIDVKYNQFLSPEKFKEPVTQCT